MTDKHPRKPTFPAGTSVRETKKKIVVEKKYHREIMPDFDLPAPDENLEDIGFDREEISWDKQVPDGEE